MYEHVNHVARVNKDMHGIAAHLLAYPLTLKEDGIDEWIHMWNSCHVLREIMEYGDSDKVGSDVHLSSIKAKEVLLFLFKIGLVLFDRKATECKSSYTVEARLLVNLYKMLYSIVCELNEISASWGKKDWFDAMKHLVVRRLIFEESPGGIHDETVRVFQSDDLPTIKDCLTVMKEDVFEFIELLQVISQNVPDREMVQDQLAKASIDLSSIIAEVRLLNGYSKDKYPIDLGKLNKLEKLLGDQQESYLCQ